jgi:hypothetical protein
MAQAKGTDGGFAADREGFGKQLIQGLALSDALLEFIGFSLESRIIECFQTLFQLIDPRDILLVLAQDPLVAASEKLGKKLIEHG